MQCTYVQRDSATEAYLYGGGGYVPGAAKKWCLTTITNYKRG